MNPIPGTINVQTSSETNTIHHHRGRAVVYLLKFNRHIRIRSHEKGGTRDKEITKMVHRFLMQVAKHERTIFHAVYFVAASSKSAHRIANLHPQRCPQSSVESSSVKYSTYSSDIC